MSASDSHRLSSRHPTEPSRTWLTPLVWVVSWLGSVTVATGLVCGGVWFVRSSSIPSQTSVDSWLWGSRDKKLSVLREVYDGRRPVLVDSRQADIKKFLSELTKLPTDGEQANWLQFLDDDRFRGRVLGSPWVKSLGLFDRGVLVSRRIEEFTIEAPNQFHQIDLVRISPWPRIGGPASASDEILVFTYAHRGYGDGEPVLFWLHETNGHWKLVDWEYVNGGSSESESAGLWESAIRDKLATGYQEAHLHLREADALPYSSGVEYERRLRQAEACRVPSRVEDFLRYMIVNRWNHRSCQEEVRRLSKSIRDPDRFPGIHVLNARACQRLGETDEALAAVDRLEHLIGFRPSMARLRAELLQQSNRRNDALVEWQRLADFDPGEVSYLNELYKLLPKSRRLEVIERIKAQSAPAPLALQFAQFNSNRLTSTTLQDLSQLVKDAAPDSSEARDIEIVRLRKDGDYRAAAALYRAAAEHEADPALQRYHWANYLREMNEAGELLAGFAEHPDPKSAFQLLVNRDDDDEPAIPIEDLPSFLAAYREKEPNDPWLYFYEGFIATQHDQFAEADRIFATAEQMVLKQQNEKKETPPNDAADGTAGEEDLERLRDQLRRQRCRVRYELGEDVNVLVDYKYHETAYQTLASLAVQYRHWPVLIRLNRSFEKAKPGDPWLLYYNARAFLSAKNFMAVNDTLKRMARREKEHPYLKYWREQLERELSAAEYPDPLMAFSRSADRPSAFNQLSNKLLAERDWITLEKLCEKYQSQSNSVDLLQTRLEQAWRQSDDARLIELLTPWPSVAMSKQPYFEPIWRERLVRSLLRTNRWDEARVKARDAQERLGEVWPLVMSHIAKRDAEAISALLIDDELLVDQWSNKDFAADSALRPVLLDDAFDDLRQQQLFAFPNYRSGESLILFLRKSSELSESWLLERLAEPENSPQTAPKVWQISEAKFVVNWRGNRFAIMSEAEPYFTAEFLKSPAFTNREHDSAIELDSLFAEQRAYWRIVPVFSEELQPWNSPAITVREFGAKLLNNNVVGAMHQPTSLMNANVIAINESQSELLARRVPFPELNASAITLRVHQPEVRLDVEKKRALQKLSEGSEPLEQPFQILAHIQLCDAEIPMTVPFCIHQVRHKEFVGYELIVEYAGTESCNGFPELRPGIRFVVPLNYVTDTSHR